MSSTRSIYDGVKRHKLAHLQPFTFSVTRPAIEGKSETSLDVHATFSWHCYTRTPADNEEVYLISSGVEKRCFCPDRYQYSFRLPGIIAGLAERKVLQTGRSNFVTIEFVDEDGTRLDYEIYFQVRKQGNGKPLKLYVESAYIRRSENKHNRPKPRRQAIRFRVIVHNIQSGKAIKFKS